MWKVEALVLVVVEVIGGEASFCSWSFVEGDSIEIEVIDVNF